MMKFSSIIIVLGAVGLINSNAFFLMLILLGLILPNKEPSKKKSTSSSRKAKTS